LKKFHQKFVLFIITSTFASDSLIVFIVNFDTKHIREVFVKLNGIQALFILSIRILIKSIECVDKRFIPLKKI
jgi:hypothetical protein